MKYITNIRFRLPKEKKGEKIRKDLAEFLEIFKMAYGGVKMEWYKSKLPKTIFGAIKNSVKIKKEKANHAVVKWEGRKLMEFYYGPSKLFGFKLNGYFYDKIIEGINYDESRKVIKMIERYNMKVYKIPLIEYGITPLIIIGVIILFLIIKIIKNFWYFFLVKNSCRSHSFEKIF